MTQFNFAIIKYSFRHSNYVEVPKVRTTLNGLSRSRSDVEQNFVIEDFTQSDIDTLQWLYDSYPSEGYVLFCYDVNVD